MNKSIKDNFCEMKSEPNWLVTWGVRFLFFFLFGMIILLIYFLPVLFFLDSTIDGNELYSFGIIYYPILIGLTYVVVLYLKNLRRKSVRHITVNQEGIFYEMIDGTEEAIKFSQLEFSSNDNIVYDVFIDSKLRYIGNSNYRQAYLKVFLKGKEQEVRDFHPDLGYSYYARNSRLLRGQFIRGITLFRPDLHIAPSVYTEYSIHPETFEFDKKGYWKTIALVVVFIVLLFIGIDWYMQYRFGSSLFF